MPSQEIVTKPFLEGELQYKNRNARQGVGLAVGRLKLWLHNVFMAVWITAGLASWIWLHEKQFGSVVFVLSGFCAYIQFHFRARQKALNNLNLDIANNPGHAAVFLERGEFHFSNGKLKQALSDYSTAINLAPDDAQAYYKRAMVHYYLKKYELAIDDYSLMIQYDSDRKLEHAYDHRGRLYQMLEEHEHAVNDYSAWIAQSPDNLRARKERADCYRKLGNSRKAMEDYCKIIAVDGSDEYALEQFEQSNALLKDAWAYKCCGDAFLKRGQHNKAIDLYNKAVALKSEPCWVGASPRSPESALESLYIRRGTAFFETGQFQQAIEDYTHAIDFNRQSYWANIQRGDSYHKMNRDEEAIQDYATAIGDLQKARTFAEFRWMQNEEADAAIQAYVREVGLIP